jgi:hypothetical protein
MDQFFFFKELDQLVKDMAKEARRKRRNLKRMKKMSGLIIQIMDLGCSGYMHFTS